MESHSISVIIPAYNAGEYLNETLDSIVNQTFQDFEVIIINDGSTDNTQDIIDEYCGLYQSFKSYTQDNMGVSNARNRGIDEAHGDYIAFLDADDLFTINALENLYNYAISEDAELVVGISCHFNSFGSTLHQNTVKLASIQHIKPLEKQLIWTFSQCNKLFLRKKIIETGIRFPDLKYAEDGVFVLKYAYKCTKITGCPHKVVAFRKHDFWESQSITQKIDSEQIKHYLKSHDIIYENALKSFNKRIIKAASSKEKARLTVDCYNYLDGLLYRRVAIILNEFYRLFWKTDDFSLKLINKTVLSTKNDMYPISWLKLQRSFNDLSIDRLALTQKELAQKPFISILLNPNEISESNLQLMIDSIYSQDFICFEVIVPEKLYNRLDKKIEAENLHIIPEIEDFNNISLERALGEYIIHINDFIILNPNALKTVYNHIYNGFFDVISVKLNQLEDTLNIKKSLKKTCTAELVKYDYIDFNINNKFIKKAYLNKKQFKFTSDLKKDIKTIYEGAKYKNIGGYLLFGQRIVTSNYKKLPQSVYLYELLGKTVKLVSVIGIYTKFFKIKTNNNMYNQGYLVAIFYIISSIKERFTEIRNRL
jgi:CDP-ribitol ribitolphosphotransferase / teichoic acid ribitol-phosphate polymerase